MKDFVAGVIMVGIGLLIMPWVMEGIEVYFRFVRDTVH